MRRHSARDPRVLAGVATLIGVLVLAAPAPAPAEPAVAAGVVRSDEKIEVKSKLALPIQRVAIAEGDVVKKGDLLVELTNDVLRAHVESAKAEVRRAEAAVGEAEAAIQRARSAVAEYELKVRIASRELERNQSVADLITEKELQLSRDAVERAAAELRTWQDEVARLEAELGTRQEEVARARAQLGVAQANLEETLIRAPFDGLVSRVYLRVGATPKPSDTALLDFLTLDRLYIEAAVPLAYLHSIRQGMTVQVVVEDEHRPVKTSTVGRIKYVYPEIDTATRMVRVKIEVDRIEQRILPGMLAKITINAAGRPR